MNFGLPWQTGKSVGEPEVAAGWASLGVLDPPGPRLADPPGVPGGLQGAWGDEHEQLHMQLPPEQHSTG